MNGINGAPDNGAAPVLITGGGGFIGCNIADALAARGTSVLVFDNMSRDGAEENVTWLKQRHGDRIAVELADIRDTEKVERSSIAETAALDLYSPYACSKGAADHYARDYARGYGLRTAVLRMSCVYGPRQFGTEDQGWIAHFMLQSIRRRPITIFGDGLQVRDALHIDDAVAAWLGTLAHIDAVRGRVFNLGGGSENAVSLLELVELIGRMRDYVPDVRFDLRRPGDQPWYVSDTTALSAAIGWRPRVPLQEGLRTLEEWLCGRFGAARLPHREVA